MTEEIISGQKNLEKEANGGPTETNQILISATFTANPIIAGIEFYRKEFGMSFTPKIVDYNQTFQELLNPESLFRNNKKGLNVILVRFEDWLPYLEKTSSHFSELTSESKEFQQVKQDLTITLNEFACALQTYQNYSQCPTLVMLCPSSHSYRQSEHWKLFFIELSEHLDKMIKHSSLVSLLHVEKYQDIYQIESIDDEFRNQIGHIPFVDEYYYFLSTLVMRFYHWANSKTFKVIAVDCDNTLWKGVCGEIAPGEMNIQGTYKELQQFLIGQKNQGMLLCLCSKNNEDDVWKVFDHYGDFPLQRQHLADYRINWQSKSENLRSLAESLNIGLDSFIFIDDNPVECAEVKSRCPEVLTLQWPDHEEQRQNLMHHTWAFDHFMVTAEDVNRTVMIQQNLERQSLLNNSNDFNDFIKNLKLEVDILSIKPQNVTRVAQLTNRTNQFNFTTIRRNENLIQNLLAKEKYECKIVNVSDRFGQYGLVGVMIFKQMKEELFIDSFMLSCRVLGRGVEYKMLAELGKIAFDRNIPHVKVRIIETEKNKPAQDFLNGIARQFPIQTKIENNEKETIFLFDAFHLSTIQYIPFTLPDSKAATTIKRMENIIEIEGNTQNINERFIKVIDGLYNVQLIFQAITANAATMPILTENKYVTSSNAAKVSYSQILATVKKIFADTLLIDEERIDVKDCLENYVKDSFKIVELTVALQKIFPDISATFLFEHSSLEEIVQNIFPKSDGISYPVYNGVPSLHTADKKIYSSSNDSEPFEVAIIGLNGKFPGAETIEQFWQNLLDGATTISQIPDTRWNADFFYDPDGENPGKSHSKWGGFIQDVDCFDTAFFHISPKEAELMDPQQRLFLEVAWGLMEDACYTRESIAADTGVFVGVMANDYSNFVDEASIQGQGAYRCTDTYQIPNRVSYIMNFHGPSIAINTACSASGTAVHLAYESLRRGECSYAIAGGVNLLLHPSRYIQYSQMKILTKDNKCCPFGAEASGTIFGEGIGALLLKPLDQAKLDRDNIYAVIKGTAINSGGKTNGFTVPNPNAQAELITNALDNSQIPARTIGYVEAHGTGTPLGDPIEAQGLIKAFHQNNSLPNAQSGIQYCALGSVKSNIGHLESGAAIAGIIKILYQMKHKMIVPSLHANVLNPLIPFESSPFYVPQQAADWKKIVLENADGNKQTFPRRAGISSFGAGGSNNHIILEEFEYINSVPESKGAHLPIIILSARHEEALRKMAYNVYRFIEYNQPQAGMLEEIAYSLQIGREQFKYRLAIICDSIDDLQAKLKTYIDGRAASEEIITSVIQNPCAYHVNLNSEVDSRFLDNLFQTKDYMKIAALWSLGVTINWDCFYRQYRPRRISLPTYPFDKERCWIEHAADKPKEITNTAAAVIHPLVQQNISRFSEQRFSSLFTGCEFFLADHVMNGKRILPGVAHLEMARFAVQAALGEVSGLENDMGIGLKNIVWIRPLGVDDEAVRINIGLMPDEKGEIKYEIYNDTDNEVIYSQGSAFLNANIENFVLDLPALHAECSQYSFSADHLYETFNRLGVEYGPGFRGVQEIYFGRSKILAKLSLPASVAQTEERLVLHPSILDAAFQASIWFGTLDDSSGNPIAPKLSQPFSLQELNYFGSCTSSMWALIQNAKDYKAEKGLQKLDIDLCDTAGKICVRMKGYSSIVPEGAAKIAVIIGDVKPLIFQPLWQEKVSAAQIDKEYNQHLVVLCEMDGISEKEIEAGISGVRCLALRLKETSIDKRFQTYAEQILEEIKYMFKHHIADKVLIQILIPRQGEQQVFAGLAGLIKTARLENSKITAQLIEVELGNDSSKLVEKLAENSHDPESVHISYHDGKRWVAGWKEAEKGWETNTLPKAEVPWKDRGIYLITGGAGGLGLLFSKEIAEMTDSSMLILTGRSPLNEAKKNQIKEIEASGAKVKYIQVDITDKQAVHDILAGIRKKFGGLNGIIHCAGTCRDNYIVNKTKEELREVLAPKVTGLVNVDEASQDMKLDFMVLFSSISGSLGNAGQADYAAANSFMDAYATYRNELTAKDQRYGRTISINWPLWKEGGMKIDGALEKIIHQSTGMVPMQTRNGIQTFYGVLASDLNQAMVLEGEARGLRSFVSGKRKDVESITKTSSVSGRGSKQSPVRGRRPEMKGLTIAQCLEWDIKQHISRLLKIPREKIDRRDNFAQFGFDSITLTQFAILLIRQYGVEMTPAVFFGYSSVEQLCLYIMKEYEETIHSFYQGDAVASKESNNLTIQTSPFKIPTIQSERLLLGKAFKENETFPGILEPIAVIGMSGRFPGTRNINELWEVLSNGQSMIREIPAERFDWRPYYGDPLTQPGKTNCKWFGYIPGVTEFEPLFFEISPREAELMDPRQRLLLQESWRALEDSGYGEKQIKNEKIGMFVGVEQGEYQLLTKEEGDVTSNSNAILACRLAYFLNLHGPVMAIDTACSSGLVAAYQALLSIRAGECDTAIAAGVNLLLTPAPFVAMAQAGMLSDDGVCYAFDKRANGMVPGEAVAAVVFKRLSQAVADGDPIYAVVKGSGINYDGKTNGLTAPNGLSQTNLLKSVYEQYKINPEEINYMVTHGTATRLGDPIEINALYDAFKGYTKKQGYCALTSTKTNFGHCQAASGLVSLISLVQAIRHKTIPASLNCEQESDYINWKESPFYINKMKRDWPAGMEEKRTGAVSAFGMSGTNVHMVVESYSEQTDSCCDNIPYYLLAFSAKTQEALQEKIKDMIEFLQDPKVAETDLIRISHTLLEGRQHFKYRCAVVIQDKEHAIYVLRYFENTETLPNLFRGKVGRDFISRKAIEQYAQELLAQSWSMREERDKYQEILFALAEFYCQGYEIDWKPLFGTGIVQRMHLPTYPFAKEQYWMSNAEIQGGDTNNRNAAPIHPFVHVNISDFSEQKYSSTFTGQEIFLTDYAGRKCRIFPETVYLEMARSAVENAMGTLEEPHTGIRLKNVCWAQPMTVGEQPFQVHIRLYPLDNSEIHYQIYTASQTDNAEETVHCEGNALAASISNTPVLDLASLIKEFGESQLSFNQRHDVVKKNGVSCLSQLGIQTFFADKGRILAKIRLPESSSNAKDQLLLQPGLLNSALQAAAYLINNSCSQGLLLPLALQDLEVFHKPSSSMWVLIRFSKSSNKENIPQQLDIDLCDETGIICMRLKGLTVKSVDESTFLAQEDTNDFNPYMANIQEPYEMMTFAEVWQEEALPEIASVKLKTVICFLSNPQNQQTALETIQKLDSQTSVIFIAQGNSYKKQSEGKYTVSRMNGQTYNEAFQNIQEEMRCGSLGGNVAILYLWAVEDVSCIEDYSCIVHLLQALAFTKLKAKHVLLGAQFSDGLQRCYLESWIGFERSLGMTLPNTKVVPILQESKRQAGEADIISWLEKLWPEMGMAKAQSVLYQNEKRHIYQVQPTTLSDSETLIRPGKTYLITGGCGGLGLLFAEHLAKYSLEASPVNLILCGRSSLDAKKEAKIRALEELGSRVMHLQADVSDAAAMEEGLRRAKKCFGTINGVIHAAGIIQGQTIFEKDFSNFQKVLEPKIKGTLVLDNLLQEDELEFICYFTSTSAIIGDFGSCDYAIANRFLMAFTDFRNQEQQRGARRGKAVAINWPLWKDGGMGMGDEENTKMYLKSSGQGILEAKEGLNAFEQIVGQHNPQNILFIGQPSRVHRFLGLIKDQPVIEVVDISTASGDLPGKAKGRRPEMQGLTVEQCVEWDLKQLIYRLLKIPRDKIEKDANLADFGFNSINLTQFAILLIKHYRIDEITPTLFFKHSTLKKLIQYFLTEHQETIQDFYQEDFTGDLGLVVSSTEPVIQKVSKADRVPKRQDSCTRFVKRDTSSDILEPIAIIGMSGRFPGARHIDEMWEILAAGQNMVQEIPIDRFDWRQYYGDPAKEPGKISGKWCGCISGVGEFEPLFFEISPREAEMMDPRQRLLIQESWKALEDAGYGEEQITTQKIGMFVGVEQGDYQKIAKEQSSITSNHNGILAARLAYFLNLNGPVMAIDTACSSGLVAAHQAVMSLRAGECDTAIVAGVNLLLTPAPYMEMSQAGMLSADGRCYTFDRRANGMVPGEAVAVVVLKKVSLAEAEGDSVYAVIKGSGINYDGKTNGITAPSGAAQTNLIKGVYSRFGIHPEEIDYIVTHGTGTKLGDPIEINALIDAFKDGTRKESYCALTSTKTNFGHSAAASGLVSLISLVQALRHETIPASLNCEQENDYINWKGSPFYVNKVNKTWPAESGKPRTGAVSAFGMSGTNAHMVVQSYEEDKDALFEPFPYYLLAFSAKTQGALEEKIKNMIEVLQNPATAEKDLIQISYTLLEGRHHFQYRCAIVAQDKAGAVYAMKQLGKKERLPNLFEGKTPREFAGQKVIEEYVQNLLKQSLAVRDNRPKYQEILYALADLYCQGYKMDGRQLFSGLRLQRIHLPTYPFARGTYWIDEQKIQMHTNSSTMVQEFSSDTFYEKLIDEIMQGSVSTEIAAQKTKKIIGIDR